MGMRKGSRVDRFCVRPRASFLQRGATESSVRAYGCGPASSLGQAPRCVAFIGTRFLHRRLDRVVHFARRLLLERQRGEHRTHGPFLSNNDKGRVRCRCKVSSLGESWLPALARLHKTAVPRRPRSSLLPSPCPEGIWSARQSAVLPAGRAAGPGRVTGPEGAWDSTAHAQRGCRRGR